MKESITEKYPKASKYLKKTGMSIEEAYNHLLNESLATKENKK